jgi:cell division protein FtsB
VSEFPQGLEADLVAPEAESPAPTRRGGFFSALWALPRWLISRFGLMALGALAIGGLIYMAAQGDGFLKQNELEQEKVKLEGEIEALQDENRLLRERLERLKNDPAFVEDEARKKLGLIRSGETVYRLSEEPDLADDLPEPPLP